MCHLYERTVIFFVFDQSTYGFVCSEILILILLSWAFASCKTTQLEPESTTENTISPSTSIGTIDDRQKLFDGLLEETLAVESITREKNVKYQQDILANLKSMESEFLSANTDEELFFAIVKFRCMTRDPHLEISPVKGGLKLHRQPSLRAPLQFSTDFSTPERPFMFLSNYTENIRELSDTEEYPGLGDKVIKVNEIAVNEYVERAKAYLRYATSEHLWMRLSTTLGLRDELYLPSWMYEDQFTVTLQGEKDREYDLSVPYLRFSHMKWVSDRETLYPDFSRKLGTPSFNAYLPRDRGKKVLVLDWKGFGNSLVRDLDELMDLAESEDLLDHDLIIDMTRSKGGSQGDELVRIISSRPYVTTFGNIKLSERSIDFVRSELEPECHRILSVKDAGEKERTQAEWLLSWIVDDIYPRFEKGEEYSSQAPFKCMAAPYDSGGIVFPYDRHFRGRVACLFSPWSGSHVDQFAAIVADNDLATSIGMPTAGYSNTWEKEDVLFFEDSKNPIVLYTWSLGDTFCPEGKLIAGNPKPVDVFIPQTRENYKNYRNVLVERAIDHFKKMKDH